MSSALASKTQYPTRTEARERGVDTVRSYGPTSWRTEGIKKEDNTDEINWSITEKDLKTFLNSLICENKFNLSATEV